MAPSIPTWFEEALEREFQGRLRLRWSKRRKEWHLEERVGRGIFAPPRRVEPDDDRVIRARDGYSFIAAIQPKDTRGCPECHLPIRVPHLKFKEVRCEYCGFRGLSGRLVLAYFPFSHALLEHIRKHDPLRDRTQQNVKEVDLHNQRLELGLDRDFTNARQDLLYEGLEATHFAAAGFPSKAKDYERKLWQGQ